MSIFSKKKIKKKAFRGGCLAKQGGHRSKIKIIKNAAKLDDTLHPGRNTADRHRGHKRAYGKGENREKIKEVKN